MKLAQRFAGVEVERNKGAMVGTATAPQVEYLVSYMCLSDEESIELHVEFDR